MTVQNRDSVIDGQIFVAPGGKTMVCRIVEGIRFYMVGDVACTSPSKAAVVANGGSGSYNGWVYWTEAEVAAVKAAGKESAAARKPGAVKVTGGVSVAGGLLYDFLSAPEDSSAALVESIVGSEGMDDADVAAAAKFVAESLAMLKVGMGSLAAARSSAGVRAAAEVERARAAAIAAECEAANLAQAELVAAYEAGQSAEVAAAVIEGSGVKVKVGGRK